MLPQPVDGVVDRDGAPACEEDYDAATFQARVKCELLGVGLLATATLIIAICQVAGLSTRNWVLTACLGFSILLHLATAPCRGKGWVSVVTIVLDCILAAGSDPIVQCAFWNSVYRPLHLGTIPCAEFEEIDVFALHYYSLLNKFLVFVSLSYAIQFVYILRQAVVGLLLGGSCYFVVVCKARSSLDHRVFAGWSDRPGFELLMMVAGFLVVLAARRKCERHERASFEMNDICSEKTPSPPVDFGSAPWTTVPADGEGEGSDAGDRSAYPGCLRPEVSCSLDAACAPKPKQLKSQSAPADLFPATLECFLRGASAASRQDSTSDGMSDGCGSCCHMDCFPVDATVWAEGHSVPLPVGQLVPSQRVLCFDNLQGSVRYAALSAVAADSKAVEWAEVTLEDGTKLTMTSDHPVQPARVNGHTLGPFVVPAAELQPGRDHVMVHRVVTVPVRVAGVSCFSAVEPRMRDRVSLAVHQPSRYSIMVAAPGQKRDIRSLAVASIDHGKQVLQVKNGSIHVSSQSHEAPRLQRAVSEPNLLPLGPPAWPPLVSSHPAQSSNSESSAPSASLSAYRDSAASSSSSARALDHDRSEILIPATCPRERDQAGLAVSHRHAAVSSIKELLDAKESGLPSVGSRSHASGTCVPCHLHIRGRCSWGVACQFCHGEHLQKKRRGRKVLEPV